MKLSRLLISRLRVAITQTQISLKLPYRAGIMQLCRLPSDVLKVLGEASREWIKDLATNSDSLTQCLANSYLEARSLLKPWSEISEGWFLAGRETF